MKDYVIITDATSDLPFKLIDELGIRVIPMPFSIGDDNYQQYHDARELSFKEFYQRLRQGEKAVTTQINIKTYMEYFEDILKTGNDIIYFSLSSGLSGTYDASLLAASDLKQDYPQAQIICVDTRGASIGEGLLVYSAALKKTEGLDLPELHDWIIDQRSHLCHWFTVDDLNHLRRGGRLNTVTAVIGTALDIKPILRVNREGKIIPVTRVRGRKKALKALVEQLKITCLNPEQQVIFIGHCDCYDDAELLASLIRAELMVKDLIISDVGPIIGTHTGPGTLAIFYFGSE